MPILFYDHLVPKSEIITLINTLEGEDNHRYKAHQLVDDILFQGIIFMLLNKLHEEKHSLFLEMVHERPYDTEIIIYLREHTHSKIEDDIQREAEKLIRAITKDMLP